MLRSVFYTIAGPQLPPQRRITQDEASASMQFPPNQNHTQQQQPLHTLQQPLAQAQHTQQQQGSGTGKAGSSASFASAGFGSVAGGGTAYGGAGVSVNVGAGAGYAGQVGLTRLSVGHASDGPPRKKGRMG